MLTRKDCKSIAEIIKEHTAEHRHPHFYAWRAIDSEILCYKLADYFVADNPLFDRERFLSACGTGVTR